MTFPVFTALTLNIQNGQVWDAARPDSAPVDLGRTLEFLRSVPSDIYFLQEVEAGCDFGTRGASTPNYDFLRENLDGYDSVFCAPPDDPDELPFGLGLAIFSKAPLFSVEKLSLPAAEISFEFGGRMRRPVERNLIAATAVFDGTPVRLLNTHLQAYFMIGSTSEEHRGQRDAVENILRRNSGTPSLLAGDFNIGPGERVVEQFAGTGFSPVQTALPTWKRMPYVVDHLFYNHALRLVRAEVIETDASDHHAVQARFAIQKHKPGDGL